jgi:hypothetical protein
MIDSLILLVFKFYLNLVRFFIHNKFPSFITNNVSLFFPNFILFHGAVLFLRENPPRFLRPF